jgi:Ubinuclein conserved middle domain
MGTRLGCAVLSCSFFASETLTSINNFFGLGLQESPGPHREGSDGSMQKDKDATKVLKELQEKEPPKKYRLTENMKTIFWQLYCLSNECSRLTNEKK